MNLTFAPTICHINLGALGRNFQRLGRQEKILPVIKSDAYGHGLYQAAKTLNKCGAMQFAVGTANEGAYLRSKGFTQKILPLLGCNTIADWNSALKYNLITLIRNFDDLRIANNHSSASRPLSAAIKLNTGMGRLGFQPDDLNDLLSFLDAAPHIRPILLVSHLACADMPEECAFTDRQIQIFNTFYQQLKQKHPAVSRSLSNSAASLGIPQTDDDWIRPGLALYGGNPYAGTANEDLGKNFEWVMSLSAPIIQVHSLLPGESVSYGHTFTADRPMKAGVVPAGYATGLSRGLSNKISLVVQGKRVKQIGNICMGMLIIDLTDIPSVKAGEDAWIIGGHASFPDQPVTPLELAKKMNTIPYEVLCLLGSLNPRVYEY